MECVILTRQGNGEQEHVHSIIHRLLIGINVSRRVSLNLHPNESNVIFEESEFSDRTLTYVSCVGSAIIDQNDGLVNVTNSERVTYILGKWEDQSLGI